MKKLKILKNINPNKKLKAGHENCIQLLKFSSGRRYESSSSLSMQTVNLIQCTTSITENIFD